MAVRGTWRQPPSQKMCLNDFPPELLAKIFLQLSYRSLLSVVAVSVQWNSIVTDDPALGVQMFKKGSEVYVEPGCHERMQWFHPDPAAAEAAEPIRLPPAVQKASYTMGNDIASVYYYNMPDFFENPGAFMKEDAVSRRQIPRNFPKLTELAIANDLISIPAVTMIMIQVQVPVPMRPTDTFTIEVKNDKGVRLIDLFTGLQTECVSCKCCFDFHQTPGCT
ncbi:hypothetical protein B0H11DRAFT_1257465 [Mycena galericulata]|nr:hypothetical protein B0H11DRAFT_1257465 [Mycena galericulata]